MLVHEFELLFVYVYYTGILQKIIAVLQEMPGGLIFKYPPNISIGVHLYSIFPFSLYSFIINTTMI